MLISNLDLCFVIAFSFTAAAPATSGKYSSFSIIVGNCSGNLLVNVNDHRTFIIIPY